MDQPFQNPLHPGPHAVGVKAMIIQDLSRPFDPWGAVHARVPEYKDLLVLLDRLGQTRRLLVDIYHPTEPSAVDRRDLKEHPLPPRAAQVGTQMTFLDFYAGDRAHFDRTNQRSDAWLTQSGQTLGELKQTEPVAAAALEQRVLDNLARRARSAFRGAPVTEGAYPVLILSHGGAGRASRQNFSTLSEIMASHGYIVVAVTHTADSNKALVWHEPESTTGALDTSTLLYQEGLSQSGGDPAGAEAFVRAAYDAMSAEANAFRSISSGL